MTPRVWRLSADKELCLCRGICGSLIRSKGDRKLCSAQRELPLGGAPDGCTFSGDAGAQKRFNRQHFLWSGARSSEWRDDRLLVRESGHECVELPAQGLGVRGGAIGDLHPVSVSLASSRTVPDTGPRPSWILRTAFVWPGSPVSATNGSRRLPSAGNTLAESCTAAALIGAEHFVVKSQLVHHKGQAVRQRNAFFSARKRSPACLLSSFPSRWSYRTTSPGSGTSPRYERLSRIHVTAIHEAQAAIFTWSVLPWRSPVVLASDDLQEARRSKEVVDAHARPTVPGRSGM